MSTQSSLSPSDVAKLLSDPSVENRELAARKVGEFFAGQEPTDSERAIAEDIFRVMVKDAELRVRKALADTLKESPDLPHDVASSLARDVNEVALPIILCSSVLSDEDLFTIIAGDDEERQLAVARREHVSGDISEALVDTDQEGVVSALVANEGAEIRELTFQKALDKFPDSEAVKTPMVRRSALPLGVAERLVTMVSENLREHIVTHHELSPSVATDLLLESRERATVSLLSPGSKAPDVLGLIAQLHKNGRLTPTLIIRALCMGDITFFEAALARLAGISVANAYQLIHDQGGMGLERLFESAEMPKSFLKVGRIGVSIANEMQLTGGDDRDTFRKIIIERVLTQVEGSLDVENLDYLIGKLGRAA